MAFGVVLSLHVCSAAFRSSSPQDGTAGVVFSALCHVIRLKTQSASLNALPVKIYANAINLLC